MTIFLHPDDFEVIGKVYRDFLACGIYEQPDKLFFRETFQPAISRLESLLEACVYESPLTQGGETLRGALTDLGKVAEYLLSATTQNGVSEWTRSQQVCRGLRSAVPQFAGFKAVSAGYAQYSKLNQDAQVLKHIQAWAAANNRKGLRYKANCRAAVLHQARKKLPLTDLFCHLEGEERVLVNKSGADLKTPEQSEAQQSPVWLTLHKDAAFGLYFEVEMSSEEAIIPKEGEPSYAELVGQSETKRHKIFLGGALALQLEKTVTTGKDSLVAKFQQEYQSKLGSYRAEKEQLAKQKVARDLKALLDKAKTPEERKVLLQMQEALVAPKVGKAKK